MKAEVQELIDRLGLEPHPEGGYFREIYRAPMLVDHPNIPANIDSTRPGSSLIYFLLRPNDFSAFHKVRWSDEIWHHYAGGPLEIHMIDNSGLHMQSILSNDIRRGDPAVIIPAGYWQAARPINTNDWTLCGCTVAPGFEFADFELPKRGTLISEHPQHAELIESLTRSEVI